MANELPITGLLASGSPSNPLLDLGVGLLSASGPQRNRVSLGQALASGIQYANQNQARHTTQNYQNEIARQKLLKLTEQRRQGSALQDFFSTFGTNSETGQPGVNLSPQQQAYLRLQAQVDPQAALQMTGGLLFPEDERSNAFLQNVKALGIDQDTARQLFIRKNLGQDISGQIEAIQAQNAATESQIKLMQLNQLNEDANQRKLTKQEASSALRSDIYNQIRDLSEAATIIDNIEGTFAETGSFAPLRTMGLSAAALIGEQVGFDTSKQRQLATQSQRFGQIANTTGVDNFKNFRGQISDLKFSTLLNNDLSANKTPQANRFAIADRLEAVLDTAATKGISVPNRPRVVSLITQLRNTSDSNTAEPTSNNKADTVFDYDPTSGQLIPQ